MELRGGIEEAEELKGPSWAGATRRLRQVLKRVRDIGKDDARWETEVWPPPSHGDATNRWHIEGNTWRAAWAGEQRFWSIARKLHKAGIKSPAHLPVVTSGEGTGGRARANILPKGLRSTQETDGRQHGRPLLMHTNSILSKKERTALQGFLDLVDWKGEGVNLASRDRRGQHISAATTRPCRQCGGSEVPPGGVESQSGKDLNSMAWHLRGGLCLRCRPQTSTPSITTWMQAVARRGTPETRHSRQQGLRAAQ